MEPVKWPEAAEAIADRIRSGSVPVGARLPRAAVLAQELGVAERTARKALAHLAALGVLEIRPNVGIYAASVPTSPLPAPPAPEDPVAAIRREVAELRADVAELQEWRRQQDAP